MGRRSRSVGALATSVLVVSGLLAGAGAATGAPRPAAVPDGCVAVLVAVTCTYDRPGQQSTFTVPPGATDLRVTARGGRGGDGGTSGNGTAGGRGGSGDVVAAAVPAASGDVLDVRVGQDGGRGEDNSGRDGAPPTRGGAGGAGYGSGGAAGQYDGTNGDVYAGGGGGGGGSAVLRGVEPLAVAGGGGGGGAGGGFRPGNRSEQGGAGGDAGRPGGVVVASGRAAEVGAGDGPNGAPGVDNDGGGNGGGGGGLAGGGGGRTFQVGGSGGAGGTSTPGRTGSNTAAPAVVITYTAAPTPLLLTVRGAGVFTSAGQRQALAVDALATAAGQATGRFALSGAGRAAASRTITAVTRTAGGAIVRGQALTRAGRVEPFVLTVTDRPGGRDVVSVRVGATTVAGTLSSGDIVIG